MIYNAYQNQHKTDILKHTNIYTYTIAKGGNFTGWASFELKGKTNMC